MLHFMTKSAQTVFFSIIQRYVNFFVADAFDTSNTVRNKYKKINFSINNINLT